MSSPEQWRERAAESERRATAAELRAEEAERREAETLKVLADIVAERGGESWLAQLIPLRVTLADVVIREASWSGDYCNTCDMHSDDGFPAHRWNCALWAVERVLDSRAANRQLMHCWDEAIADNRNRDDEIRQTTTRSAVQPDAATIARRRRNG